MTYCNRRLEVTDHTVSERDLLGDDFVTSDDESLSSLLESRSSVT